MERKVEELRKHFGEMLSDIKLPSMYRVHQRFPRYKIEDPGDWVRHQLEHSALNQMIDPGMTIAITASSRGIRNQKEMLKAIADFVKKNQANPVIIPAMGSHGGSTADGQREILTEYGITEDFCQCRIHSEMATVNIGQTPDGQDVYIDSYAMQCDGIIVFGRIKPHSAFKARYESGLVKMMAIGLGKQQGADSLHDAGFGCFESRLPAYAKVILEASPILAGIGIIENAHDETCRIDVLMADEILEKEPGLLEYAKQQMPRIHLPKTDVLIVREIGKNFSGSGMDPNITGTWSTPYGTGGITKQRVVVLDLTDESHGNIIGLGKADVTTKRAVDKFEAQATYSNVLTSTVIEPAKIPMWMVNDELAIKAAIKTLTGVNKANCRMIMINNTLDLECVWVSEALLAEVTQHPNMKVISGPHPWRFDDQGNLMDDGGVLNEL